MTHSSRRWQELMRSLTIILVLLFVAMLIIAETSCTSKSAGTYVIGIGDSIMSGDCLSSTDKGLLDLIADYYSEYSQMGTQQLVVVNKGIRGARLDDMGYEFYGSRYGFNAKLFALVGYNDMRGDGNGTGVHAYFKNKLLPFAAWSALPIGEVKLAQGPGITYKGQWQNESTAYGGGMTKRTTQKGATAEFELQGTVLYLSITDLNGASGQVRVETRDISGEGSWIDKGTYNCFDLDIAPTLWRPIVPPPAPHLIRLTGYSGNGTIHDVRLTAVSPNGSVVSFDWAAGNTATRDFYLGDCLPMNPTGYTVWCCCDTGYCGDGAVSSYNSDIADIASTLAGDGLKVHLVHASEYYNVSTDFCSDNLHPNELGHQHIAEAFIEQIGGTNPGSNAE